MIAPVKGLFGKCVNIHIYIHIYIHKLYFFIEFKSRRPIFPREK